MFAQMQGNSYNEVSTRIWSVIECSITVIHLELRTRDSDKFLTLCVENVDRGKDSRDILPISANILNGRRPSCARDLAHGFDAWEAPLTSELNYIVPLLTTHSFDL